MFACIAVEIDLSDVEDDRHLSMLEVATDLLPRNVEQKLSAKYEQLCRGRTLHSENVHLAICTEGLRQFLKQVVEFNSRNLRVSEIALKIYQKVNIAENFQKNWLQPGNHHPQFIFELAFIPFFFMTID